MALSDEARRLRRGGRDRFAALLGSDSFASNMRQAGEHLRNGEHVAWVGLVNPEREPVLQIAASAEELGRAALREVTSHLAHNVLALFVGHPRGINDTEGRPPLSEDVRLLPWIVRMNGNAILGCMALTNDAESSAYELIAIHPQTNPRLNSDSRREHVTTRLKKLAALGLLEREGEQMRGLLSQKGFAVVSLSLDQSGSLPVGPNAAAMQDLFFPGEAYTPPAP